MHIGMAGSISLNKTVQARLTVHRLPAQIDDLEQRDDEEAKRGSG